MNTHREHAMQARRDRAKLVIQMGYFLWKGKRIPIAVRRSKVKIRKPS